jgi:hypothetical protein
MISSYNPIKFQLYSNWQLQLKQNLRSVESEINDFFRFFLSLALSLSPLPLLACS